MPRIKRPPALSVDITEEMHESLKILSKEQDLTIAQIVRAAVRKYLGKHK